MSRAMSLATFQQRVTSHCPPGSKTRAPLLEELRSDPLALQGSPSLAGSATSISVILVAQTTGGCGPPPTKQAKTGRSQRRSQSDLFRGSKRRVALEGRRASAASVWRPVQKHVARVPSKAPGKRVP